MVKSWWWHIYHTADVHSSQPHHLPNCPWLCLFQLFFPICTHWVAFQLRDKEGFIFYSFPEQLRSFGLLTRAVTSCRRALKTCPRAVTCKGVTDRLPVSRSGDTSAMKPSTLGMMLSLPVLLYCRKRAMPGIFLQVSLVLTAREPGKTCPMMLLCQLKRVYEQSLSAERWSPECCPHKRKCFYCRK